MSLSWVDILMGASIARCIWTGRKSGFVNEFFKLLGVFFAAIVALHYYARLGEYFFKKSLAAETQKEVFAFVVLTIGIYILFSLIREGWLIILKIQLPAGIDQWGALSLAILRSYLVCGLILIGFGISGNNSIKNAANGSLSRPVFKNSAAGLYQFFYSNIIHPFFPDEPLNEKAFKEAIPNT